MLIMKKYLLNYTIMWLMCHSCDKNRMLNEVREKWRKYNKIFTMIIYIGTRLERNCLIWKSLEILRQAKSGVVMVSSWQRPGMIRMIPDRRRFSSVNGRRHMTEARLLRVSILATYWSVTEREEEERTQSNVRFTGARGRRRSERRRR